MYRKILLFLIAIMPCLITVEAGTKKSNLFKSNQNDALPTINVLIVHDKEDVLIDVRGRYKLLDPLHNKHLSSRVLNKAQLVKPMREGLKWGEEFPGLYQIEFIPASSDTQILVEGIEYRGRIQVYDIGGTISVVNKLPIEEYLVSVLPQQFRQKQPYEVMAALAIMARTDAYFWTLNPKSNFWAVDARQVGYKGKIADEQNTFKKAVKDTQYMILTRGDPFEKGATPFAAQWDPTPQKQFNPSVKPAIAEISMSDASEMALKGIHAGEILDKAFPKSKMKLVQFSE